MVLMKFLFLLFLFPVLAFSQSFKEESEKREWHVLLHYKKRWIGGFESEVDNANFFYAKDGKTNPEAEIKASVEMFSRNDIPEGPLHPQCVFPARFQYLKKTFNLNPINVECTEFKWWKDNLPYHSVSVIFASYYANNPASMFGHTLLRINSSDKKNISDYGVDFSAISPTDHGIEFAVRGLMGGYTGLFSIKPYYMKMNEYLENENRDLWEYDLDLKPEQIGYMLDHLWELMRHGSFDYFFLDENCSYEILTLLEVANPEWNFSDEFVWKAIPIDTVKAIVKAGAVKDVHYRPAYKKTVTHKYSLLSWEEKRETKKLLEKELSPLEVKNPRVLEAAIANLRYERFEEKKFTTDQAELLKSLLVQRASLGGTVDYKDIKESLPLKDLRPDTSHDSEKYGIAIGHNETLDTYTEIQFKSAFHDFLDLDRGYPKHSVINVADLNLRYSETRKSFFFQELKYAEAMSLFPLDGSEFKWSWRAGGRSYRVYDKYCDFCVSHQLRSGGGLAKNLGFIDMTLYGLIIFNGEVSSGFYRGYRIAPGLNTGAVWTISEKFKFHYDLELNRDLNRNDAFEDFRAIHQVGLSYNHHIQHELRLNGTSWTTPKGADSVSEIQLKYNFYY